MSKANKKSKVTAFMLSMLLLFSIAFATGCSHDNDDPFSEKIDSTKTQIYVYNFYAGFRADWLISVKRQFEELYADYEGVNGKKGVQILMDNRKEYFTDGAITIKSGTNEVYFTEYMYFHAPYAADAFYDMTDWLDTPLTEFGENRTVTDKMTEEQKKYFSVDKDGTAHYYALPHYSSYEGIIYNKDLWKEKGFYFCKDYRSQVSIYDKFTSDMTNRSAGPDGESGTDDDGLPATYQDFYDLCRYIKQKGVVPFIWSGLQYKNYISGLLKALITDHEGSEMRLYFSLNGTATRLINSDGSRYGVANGTEITESNAYELARQEGRLKALEFVETILDNTDWQSAGAYDGVLSHTDAQAKYLASGKDGSNYIAMLIDGSWWEGEATDAFNDTNRRYGAGDKNERSFGFMPMPKATDKEIGGGQTFLDTAQGMTFVKSTLAEEKKDIVGKFIRFVHSDKMLREFTQITSALKAFDYDIDEDSDTWVNMTAFAKDLWAQSKNAEDIIYPISDARLFANNQAFFESGRYYRCNLGGHIYEYAPEALHAGFTAQQVFDSMIAYQKNTWYAEMKK